MSPSVLVAFHLEEWSLYHREDGSLIDIDLWRESMAWFGATGLIVIHGLQSVALNAHDKRDIVPPMEIYEFAEISEAEHCFSHYEWVYLDTRGDTPLPMYQHPTGDVVYAYGPDGNGWRPNRKPGGVCIPHVRPIGSTWAISAANCVMYDRMIKGGS
jgi:hypothetical protein